MAIKEEELQGNNLRAILGPRLNRETVESCESMFERARKNRLQFERQWYTNLAFYFGRQNVQWAPGVAGNYARMWEPPAPKWRVRLISNKIRPITRAELAKITKEKPQAFVIPASSDDDDLAAARAAEAIYEHLWRSLHCNRAIRRAAFWTLLCGTSFLKDWYDPEKKDKAGVQGVIEIEPVSPFHLFVPDPQEEELENQPYVVHALAKDPEWVNARFGANVQPDSGAGAGLLEQKFLSALGVQNTPKSHISVKEIWIKPNRKHPSGAVITWAGDTLLHQADEWPFAHGEYPFTKLDHIPTGRFYADSTIPDLIPLQKEYNRTRSQLVEAKNRMAKPQLIAPRGSVDPNKITSEPGLIIFYTPGFAPPEPIPLVNIPSYAVQELDRCQRDMDDISSQHEITRGSTPPGVTAATAISYLQEQDDSKLANTVASVEEGVERIGQHFLSHVQQFWTAQRKIKVVGDDGQFESFMFSRTDIRGNTDLKIEAGSATPRSRAAKQAFITELGKMGWIPPDRALRYLDMAETGRLYEEMQIDARQAQRENLKMKDGLPQSVNSWDNHEVHILEHDNYRKRQAFENLPDEQKMLFEQHVMQHRQLVAMSMGQPIAPGEPLPAGGAAPPGQQGQLGPGAPPPPVGAQPTESGGMEGEQ